MGFREWLLSESKQEVVALGVPGVIAGLLYELFGRNAHLIARWERDSSPSGGDEGDWWLRAHRIPRLGEDASLSDLVALHESLSAPERFAVEYRRVFERRPKLDPESMERHRAFLTRQIRKQYLSSHFQGMSLVRGIREGRVTDLAPYKRLRFADAQEKYDEKGLFRDREPVMVFSDGWRWVDAGRNCELLRRHMKNCGSVVGEGEGASMLALFDAGGKPHVIITWKPEERTLGNEQGAGGTPIKDDYSDYVVALARHLGATLDAGKSRNGIVAVKQRFGPDARIEVAHEDGLSGRRDGIFLVRSRGRQYYADKDGAAEVEDVEREVGELERAGSRGLDRWRLVRMVLKGSKAPAL